MCGSRPTAQEFQKVGDKPPHTYLQIMANIDIRNLRSGLVCLTTIT